MLSIGKVCRGEKGKQYYMILHAEDYYLRRGSGEPPGQWDGRLSKELGLQGDVGQKEFCKLFDGKCPLSNRQLRRLQKNGRPGFDLTYSVPKDLSIIYMLAPPDMKRRIEAEVFGAIKKTFAYIEDEACRTRLGAGGSEVAKGDGLVVALFFHVVSRELDPQVHVHAIVFNFTRGPDGKYRSLDASKLYDHKMAAGALFRTDLAARIEKLGFEIERDRFSWRIKGIPESLTEEFSKRSAQIRAELGDKEATAAQKAVATLKSREPKQDVDHDKLFAEWEEVARRHGLTTEQVINLIAKPKVRNEQAEGHAALQEALKQLTSSGSAFTERDLIKQTAIEGQTRGLSVEQIRDEVSSALKPATREIREDSDIVRLGVHRDGYERFTTKELYKLEQEIIQSVDRGRHSTAHCVTEASMLQAIPTKRPVKTEQIAAAVHVTQGEGSVLWVSGRAGTGKTTMVGIARRAWEKEGYTVLGCALSGKAAGELSEGAKIKSVTIAKLIYDLDNPGRKDRLTLSSKTVLVVDEAGMVGTRALHRLVMETERAGARLVLVGDERQLQSIDSGGGFAGLANRVGYAELKEITRQQDPEDRQAVYDLSNGNPGPALRSYASRGRLILGKDQADAMQHLVEDWGKDTAPLKDRLILSSTNVQAFALNQFCQDVRQKRGELGEASVTVRDGVTVHVGDRVLFTRNDRRMGVHNGDLATVVRVTAGDEENNPEQAATVRVKLDNGRIRTVSLAKYDPNDITLGYSVTTHKSQGATVNNAYVLLYGAMTDAQMAYVQASRARMVTRLYTTDDEAGPELSDLTKSMSRDRRKTMAHDVIAAGETLGQSSGRGLCHELRPEF